jgi:hypothetical protein
MKYKVRITKQPRYQDGGSPALGDFSNMTQDQLKNGPVYGFKSEPEASPVVVVPSNNQRVSMQELPVSAGRMPSSSPNIVPIPVDPKQLYTRPQYKGVSIVDYLNLLGLPTSRAFRTNLAKEYNIKNYTGTAAQNKQLISILNASKEDFIDFGKNKPIVKNNVVYYRPKPQIPVGFDSYIQGAPQNFIKQEGGEQDAQQQVLQIIQAFAQMQGIDPEEVMQQFQQMPPQKKQQAIQQMVQAVQQGQQQAQQQGPQEEQMEGMQGQNPEEEQMEPQMAYGGQMGYGLDLGARRLWMNQNSDDNSEVTDSIEEVPREQANIEAEGGETALIPYQKDGTYLHKKIKGNRHTEGGVPLNVPEGTFIYSDTKKMKLGGPVLQMFGKSEKSTKKFTPATLAKQYNIDKYKAIMDDPKSDPIKKRTAELMLQNFQKKLSQLALVQESKKGFPQGIPEVARDYYQQMQQAEQAKQTSAPKNQIQQPQETQEQQQGQDVDQDMEQGEQPQAMYGMGFQYGGGLRRFKGDEDGSTVTEDENLEPNGISIANIKSPINPKFEYGNPNSNLNKINIDNDEKHSVFQTSNYGYGQPFVSYSEPTIPYDEKWKETKIDNSKETKIDNSKGTVYDNTFSDKWGMPDKLNLLNSFINMASVKRSTPFEPAVKLDRAETYYTDPSRALAANAEQMNAARQSAAMFAGPQSRYSFNNGQYGANAANIIGQYATQNVGFGNQAAQQNAAINNQQMQYDVQRAKRLYDAGVIGEQQYQNAMRQARAATLQAYTQGEENSANRFNLSQTQSPYFGVDSRNRVRFKSGQARTDFFNAKNDQGDDGYFTMMNKLMSAPYNMSASEAADAISGRYSKSKQTPGQAT